jgi:hypothetical protein
MLQVSGNFTKPTVNQQIKNIIDWSDGLELAKAKLKFCPDCGYST